MLHYLILLFGKKSLVKKIEFNDIRATETINHIYKQVMMPIAGITASIMTVVAKMINVVFAEVTVISPNICWSINPFPESIYKEGG